MSPANGLPSNWLCINVKYFYLLNIFMSMYEYAVAILRC